MQRWTQAPAPGARPCRKERIAESSSGGFAIPIEPRMQQPRRPPNRCRPRTPASAAPVHSCAQLEVLTQSGATDLQALSQACSPAGRKKFAPHLTGGLQCARRDQLQLIPLRTVSIAHRAPHRWNSALSGTRVVHVANQPPRMAMSAPATLCGHQNRTLHAGTWQGTANFAPHERTSEVRCCGDGSLCTKACRLARTCLH